MRRDKRSGASIVEFGFVMLVLVPMLVGSVEVGLNLLLSLQTIQLARDAGHMYARGADFSAAGYKTILVGLGTSLGLSATAGAGDSVVILSTITYVDTGVCSSAGKVDTHGNPSGCTNYQKWVFSQRQTIGNGNVKSSTFGSPVTSGSGGVTLDSSGNITLTQQVTQTGAVATFNVGINPYQVVNGNVSGLPSGQKVYVAEAAANGISMAPFAGSPKHYSYDCF